MRIMKCMLIGFIVVNLAFQGYLSSVFAADKAGEIEELNITIKIHGLLKQPGFSEFVLKAKPLTINEQVFLRTIEAKAHSLLNQSAGKFYSAKPPANKPPSYNVQSAAIGCALIGAFIGWNTSSGQDSRSVQKSTLTGALYGIVIVGILNMF